MEFKFYLQSQLTKIYLDEIINLKNIYWHHSYNGHEKWIKNNIRDEDLHMLMFENNVLVGYLNLIKINVSIDNSVSSFLGIGNVCSKEKGKGYGKQLLMGVNNYLEFNNLQGMLLCKNELTDFYKKSNWLLISKNLTNKSFSENINVMMYNFNLKIMSFNYTGRNF